MAATAFAEMSFAMRTRMAVVAALAACCLAPGVAAAANEAMPLTAMTPADGATSVAGSPVNFEIDGAPPGMSVEVEVSTQNIPGVDGTLADDFQKDFILLTPSDAFPGTYRGQSAAIGSYWWTGQPGTYYWQASSTVFDAVPPFDTHHYLSPVHRIDVVAPAAPAPAPQTPQPVAGGLSLKMSASDAHYYVRTMIRRKTHHAAHQLHQRCSRRSYKSFKCKIDWYDGSKSVYAGTAGFTHYIGTDPTGQDAVFATFSFSGLRATVSCLNHHTAKHCAKGVHW